MIYDCFTFYNELEILEIRLNTLNEVIDKFVIVEANETFTGLPKEYIFEKNKQKFEKFLDKIIYIPMKFPEFLNKTTQELPWAKENYQRNYIKEGLKQAQPKDIILISDVDEIPNPQSIKKYQNLKGIKALDMHMFYFYLNNISKFHIWSKGTRMLFYKDFLSILDNDKIFYDIILQEDLNKATTPNKIRLYEGKKIRHFYPCGWHFSYIGGIERIVKKIESFSHQEWREKNPDSLEESKRMLQDKKNFGYELTPIKIASKYCLGGGVLPEYLIQNQEKYLQLFMKDNLMSINNIIFITKIIFILKKIYRNFSYLIPLFVKKIIKKILRKK